jgi:hypothetical protein
MNRKILSLVTILGLVCSGCSTIFFIENSDGTFTDPRDKLILQKCAVGQTWNGSSCDGVAQKMNWWEAMRVAKNARYLGQSDWRLPTHDEINGVGNAAGVAEKYDECKNQPVIAFWTSSRWAPSPEDNRNAWIGIIMCQQTIASPTGNFNSESEVRLVRSGQSEEATKFDQEYATVSQDELSYKSEMERGKEETFLRLTNQSSLSPEKIISSDIYSEEDRGSVIHIDFDGMKISQVTISFAHGYYPCDPRRTCQQTNSFSERSPKFGGNNEYKYQPLWLKSPATPKSTMPLMMPIQFAAEWEMSDKFLFIAYNKYGDEFKVRFYKRNMINHFEKTGGN